MKGIAKMRRLGLVLSIMFFLVSAGNTAAAEVSTSFNVKSYGATGDGVTLDTNAINKAIEACSSAGGGTVYFPAGTYLSASIRLKSNINLFLDAGSTLLAVSNKLKYVTFIFNKLIATNPKVKLILAFSLNYFTPLDIYILSFWLIPFRLPLYYASF